MSCYSPSILILQVRFVTGNKILRILKSNGMAPELPEDLYCRESPAHLRPSLHPHPS